MTCQKLYSIICCSNSDHLNVICLNVFIYTSLAEKSAQSIFFWNDVYCPSLAWKICTPRLCFEITHQNKLTGFPHLLESPGIFIGKFPGPGICPWSWKSTCKVLEFARQWCRWKFLAWYSRVSADMIVATRYVFWAAGMTKMLSWPGLCPRPCWGAYRTPQRPSSCFTYI